MVNNVSGEIVADLGVHDCETCGTTFEELALGWDSGGCPRWSLVSHVGCYGGKVVDDGNFRAAFRLLDDLGFRFRVDLGDVREKLTEIMYNEMVVE